MKESKSEVIVVDNDSIDGTGDLVRRAFGWARLVVNVENVGYAKACNQAAGMARAEILLFLNPDTRAHRGALRELINSLGPQSPLAAAGGLLVDDTGRVQRHYNRLPGFWTLVLRYTEIGARIDRWLLGGRVERWYHMRGEDVLRSNSIEQPPGACFGIRSTTFDRIGGFDEHFPLYFNDVDLCMRIMKAGDTIGLIPAAKFFHIGGASTNKFSESGSEFFIGLIRYVEKWHGMRAAAVIRSVIRVDRVMLGIISAWLFWTKNTVMGRNVMSKRAVYDKVLADRGSWFERSTLTGGRRAA